MGQCKAAPKLFLSQVEPAIHYVSAVDVVNKVRRIIHVSCASCLCTSCELGIVLIGIKTGVLADTGVDALPETLGNKTATGFVFNEAKAGTLMEAIKRALVVCSQPEARKQLQATGMQKDYSWHKSVKDYMALYERL